ncbi:hypothetical protein ACTXT7_015266, partial [Hymenolepis weldensis]
MDILSPYIRKINHEEIISYLNGDYVFPELLFIRIRYDNTSVFRSRSSSDVLTHNCQLPASHSPPLSLLLASILVLTSLNAFSSSQILTFCSTIVASSYSNSYEMVTVVAV